VVGGELPDRLLFACWVETFLNEFAPHLDVAGMCADGGGSDHVQPQDAAGLLGFGVEVVQDFEVVGQEANGGDDYVGDTVVVQRI